MNEGLIDPPDPDESRWSLFVSVVKGLALLYGAAGVLTAIWWWLIR